MKAAEWRKHITANPSGGNVLQGLEFAELKAKAGWRPRYITDDTTKISYMILEKSIPLLGNIWYCPKGPGVTTPNQLDRLLPSLKKEARKHHVFTCKIEPDILVEESAHMPAQLLKTTPIQYNFATIFVDLRPSLDDIIGALPQKGRHAIRRAERDGIVVQKVDPTDANMQIMYRLLSETAAGAGFVIRPYRYYEQFWQMFGTNGQLFFAYHQDEVVAGAFAVVYGKKSTYKDGASVRERPVYGASHLLQWNVIQWAKDMGSVEHDLGGTPPKARIKDETHPLYGIGRFKSSFNKEVTEYVGAYDVPIQPAKAWLWRKFIEKLVRRLYFKRHKQSYY